MNCTKLEKRFHKRMLQIYDDAVNIGYRPTYFKRMLQKKCGLQVAKELLASNKVSCGFTELCLRDRPDITMEATILKKPWRQLFTEEELVKAERLLISPKFDPSSLKDIYEESCDCDED